MQRLLTICGVLLCLIISIAANAQKKYANTLLWRISGKSLQHPSYLYGTMHLTDKRVFQFGDSVYKAIERCDGLAIELNPDELAAYMMNQAINEAEAKQLSSMMDEKEFERYSARLSKKFKKPAQDITAADVVKEKNRWITEFLEKGEMPTFLDGWLYNFARKQGKWVGGVEDIADQSGLLEDLVDKSDLDYLLAGDSTAKQDADKSLNQMIRLYLDQNLEGIDLMMNTDYGKTRDRLLIRRNAKMARRIDSLMAFRNMFIAIGAAHLPGDSGVIDLLRRRGFTVEPVFSKQKMDAQTYPVKTVNIPWQTYEDAGKLYSVSMPGNPASVKLLNMIDMKLFLDMSNMSAYCSMAVINTHGAANKDSLVMALARNMLKQENVGKPVKVLLNGDEGSEFIKKKAGENARIQVFFRGRVGYILFVNSVKEDVLTSADTDKFFKSLLIHDRPASATASIPFIDSVMGLQFSAPAQFTRNDKLSFNNRNNWHITTFNCVSPELGGYVALYSKAVTPGYYLSCDSIVHAQVVEQMEAMSTTLSQQYKMIQGEKAFEFIGQNNDQKNLYFRAVSFVRNNKNLMFLVITDSAQLFSPVIEQLFGSIRFITPAVPWSVHTIEDGRFSAWTPAPFRSMYLSNVFSFVSYDTTTAVSYFASADTLSKYTWYASDSSFWEHMTSDLPEGYTIQRQLDIQQNGFAGKELVMRSDTDSAIYKRIRLVLADSIVYHLSTDGKKDIVFNANSERFFKEFTVHMKPTVTAFYRNSKAQLLLEDMSSADSMTRATAKNFFDAAPYDSSHVPLLHQYLFRLYRSPYSNDTATFINAVIAKKLAELRDSTAIDFIRAQYPLLTGAKDELKNTALMLLADLHTDTSYALLADLLKQAPRGGLHFAVFNYMNDSLSQAVRIYPSLEKLFLDSANVYNIAWITEAMRSEGLLSGVQLAPYERDILKAALTILPTIRENDEMGGVMQLTQLVGSFKSAAANNVLRAYLGARDPYVRLEAAKQLLQHKQPVPATALKKLAMDVTMRVELYHMLKELKRTDLFPKEYLTQAKFAATTINLASTDDDYKADAITFLFTKTASYKGKRYLLYLYKVTYVGEEGSSSYLGIAGGYTGSALEPSEDLSGMYWKKEFDAKTVNEDLAEYLKIIAAP